MEIVERMSVPLKGKAACGYGGLKLPILKGKAKNLDFYVNTDF